MSRRTPIKELIAEESSTPSSPIRRSTRIAVRRPSMTDENHEVDRLSVSSTGSQRSISTRSRAASKSPLTLANEEEQKLPAKRTRRRGSTSSLIEEELETMARSSPVPPKIGRRTSGRSMSCSPITEMENILKTSTPQKEGRGRRRTSVLIEPVTLEPIKEIEIKLPKTSISSEETRDEDLPFKKKKAVLMQTISETAPDDVATKVNGDVHLEENEANDNGDSEALVVSDTEKSASAEEKKLVVVLRDISSSDEKEIGTDSTEKSKDTAHNIDSSDEKEANDNGDSEALVVPDTEKSTLPEQKKLVVVLRDISSSDGKEIGTDSTEKAKDTRHNTDSSSEKETVSDSTERFKGAKVPTRNSHSGMDTTAEIDDMLEKENGEDAEKRLLNSFEDKEADVLHIEQSIVESSFDEPMDVDVTATPSKVTARESMNIQESTQAEKEEEVHVNPEKNLSISRVEKLSTASDEASLNTSKVSTLKSHKSNSTDLPPDTPGTPKSKPTSKKAIPHEKSLSSPSSKRTLVDEEDLSGNVVESSQKDSPKRYSLEKKLDSPSHKTKLDTPNTQSSVLVASTMSPLRRSPRLLSHSGMKDSVDITSSPVENGQETVSEDTASRLSIKDSFDIARSPLKSNLEKVSEDIAASEDIYVRNVVANTEEKHNKTFNSTIDLDLDPALKEKISTLAETLQVDSSSDEESVTHYIDDMAEEGEEDTPSEGSNDIIDIGESVGSTASEIDSDESYEVDSFIDDDEEELELLSGEEYDLNQEKPKKTSKLKKRIVQIPDSSDEEEEKQVIHIADSETEANKAKDDSDMEKMSTRPYCGLSPPVAISIRDSPECDEILESKRIEEEICATDLINEEDNLESLEQIKEHKKDPVTPEKSVVEKISETTNQQSLNTPNNSILHENASLTDSIRRRKSSINIKENVSVREIADGSVGDRILKVVEAFCSTVNQPHDVSSGNVSFNLSLDYIGTSPPRENDDETVGRKRVLSESGVDFYQTKKRLSKEHLDSGRLSNSYNKRRSNDPFVVEAQNESLQSPSKKIKINNDEQTNVWDVSLPNKGRNSFTESSPKKLGTPEIRPDKVKRINILEDIVIPEPKRSSPKKQKQSLNVVADDGITLSPTKKVSMCEPFIITEENRPAKETKITPKRQRNLSDSTNTVHSDIQSMQIVEKKLSKKRGKKSGTDLKNDENINVSPLATSPNHTFELYRKDDSIVSQKGLKKNKKRELIAESEKVKSVEILVNENDGNKTERTKQKRLAVPIDVSITKKKQSKTKNTLELDPVHHEDIQEPSQSHKRPKTRDGKKSKPKPASDSEMSDDLDEQIHGKYSKLEKAEGLKSKSKSKKNPPAISVECKPEKVSSSEGCWKIEYLPANVKQALQKIEVKKVKSTRVYLKPKLLPSSNNPQDSWHLDVLNVTAKPTTSKKLLVANEHHPKDFKGRSTFDSKRVRRMETKELLKSKEKKKA